MTRAAIVATSAIFLASLGLAQDVTGNWVGVPANPGPLARLKRIELTLSKGRNGVLSGMMYGGAKEEIVLQCTSISLNGSKLSFTVTGPLMGGTMSFAGTLSDDGNSIDGWLLSERLKLERVGRVRTARSQPSPPETVAPAEAPPVAAAEPSGLLSRALAKLAGTRPRLLRYTCIETIQRTYYSETSKKPGADAMTEVPPDSCGGRGFSKDGHLTPVMEDRLRLDVAVAGGKEIHSWAGANSFDSRSVFELVQNGPKSTGAFGTVLVDIFEAPDRQYRFLGRKSAASGEVFEYAFDVPLETSHFGIKVGNEWRRTAYRGSFEIDPATADLVRVSLETAELGADTKMCRVRTITDYQRLPIGNGQFLIPRQSEFDTVSPNASETRSLTTFSACHEYTAESSVAFEGEAGPADRAAGGNAAAKTAASLPPGLSLTLALLAPIDTSAAAAGDAVSARVTKAVRAPGSNEILVAVGAIAHGRILDMRHQYSPSQFQYSVRYETLEQNGVVTPLAIELERELQPGKVRTGNGLSSRGTEFSLPPRAATGETGSWFAVPATSGGYVIPEGFESKWVTVGR
jgi:hypothetical protein